MQPPHSPRKPLVVTACSSEEEQPGGGRSSGMSAWQAAAAAAGRQLRPCSSQTRAGHSRSEPGHRQLDAADSRTAPSRRRWVQHPAHGGLTIRLVPPHEVLDQQMVEVIGHQEDGGGGEGGVRRALRSSRGGGGRPAGQRPVSSAGGPAGCPLTAAVALRSRSPLSPCWNQRPYLSPGVQVESLEAKVAADAMHHLQGPRNARHTLPPELKQPACPASAPRLFVSWPSGACRGME